MKHAENCPIGRRSHAAGRNRPRSAAESHPGSIIATYVTPDDYPNEAIRRGEHGSVNFEVVAGKDGRVSSCIIVQSSGSAILDKQTCRIMQERLQFKPALDSQGRPVEERFTGTFTWKLSS